ncbi:MAG: hypothetical protein MPK62_05000 [Alphaproteobacteria bacterium]|nr:hypothetical protein [Alphaproteobacteria bacterium]
MPRSSRPKKRETAPAKIILPQKTPPPRESAGKTPETYKEFRSRQGRRKGIRPKTLSRGAHRAAFGRGRHGSRPISGRSEYVGIPPCTDRQRAAATPSGDTCHARTAEFPPWLSVRATSPESLTNP